MLYHRTGTTVQHTHRSAAKCHRPFVAQGCSEKAEIVALLVARDQLAAGRADAWCRAGCRALQMLLLQQLFLSFLITRSCTRSIKKGSCMVHAVRPYV
jgi:hypothetical protein